MRFEFVIIVLFLVSTVSAQDYAHLARGAGLPRRRVNNGGNALVVGALCGVIGGCIGGWIGTSRQKARDFQEKQDLANYIQIQEEMHKQVDQQWKADYQKLYRAYEMLEKETVERDYEEFKAPDTDNDEMITKSEFNTYVRKYLASFPELSEKDFPKFEEFDLNHDGKVTFDEWQQFLVIQKNKDEKEKSATTKTGKGGSDYQDLLNALYDQSNQVDGFSGLQKKLPAKKDTQVRR